MVPSVYHRYKSFRGDPIEVVPVDQTNHLDEQQELLIDTVIKAYRDYSALDLSSITHQPGTPWARVYQDGKCEGAIIPNKLIQEHYKQRAAEDS